MTAFPDRATPVCLVFRRLKINNLIKKKNPIFVETNRNKKKNPFRYVFNGFTQELPFERNTGVDTF